MTFRKVVGILTTRADRRWSEEELELTWDVFVLGPVAFITEITQRECHVLAAIWREKASVNHENAHVLLGLARSFEEMATFSRREQALRRWSRYG